MDKNLKFYEIRGHRVLLDRDLAAVFGVETKQLKRVVKRHPELFTGDEFVFELTGDECSRYQFGALNTGRGTNLKYLPFAFTEAGVRVLKTLMKSSVDIDFSEKPPLPTVYEKSWNEDTVVLYQPDETLNLEVRVDSETVWLTQEQLSILFGVKQPIISKHLSNIFQCGELEKSSVYSILEYTATDGKTYKTSFYNLDAVLSVGYRVNSKNATKFRQWANKVLRKYILRKGAYEDRITALEVNLRQTNKLVEQHQEQLDFIINKSLPSVERIFMGGELYDAYALITDIIASARERLVLVDNYMDSSVLKMLTKRNADVSVTLYTSGRSCNNEEFKLAVEKFKTQYGAVDVRQMSMVHDRYLIADSDVYSLGASFKDAGKKLFGMFKIEFTSDEVLAKIEMS